jgi:hypothetical protein
MLSSDPADWSERARQALASYDEELLRAVTGRLARPRGHWPAEELIDRCLAASGNAAVIDRRLRDLPAGARQVLACIGHSGQPLWQLGNLVELALALGQQDGLRPVFELLACGLLYPRLDPAGKRLKNFEQWLAYPPTAGPAVFTTPLIASRAVGEDLGLPDLSAGAEKTRHHAAPAQEADGLEWLLRLAVLWQQVAAAPLRRTQQGGFFKRDHDRIAQDPLLNGPPHDHPALVPDAGLLVEALAEHEGVLAAADGELRAGALPAVWDAGLAAALESLWTDLPLLQTWNSRDGYRGPGAEGGNPFPSAHLLACLLLARLPAEAWVRPADVEDWVTLHHPYWSAESLRPSRARPWAETFLLGLAYQLRVVQAAADGAGGWRVRLSPTGRWLLGAGEPPVLDAAFPQTLLVQPNLEIIAYRQGLTAPLIAKLTRFATWKGLGAACTLQLGPESVYRALESGLGFDDIRRSLQQHGTRAVPPAVFDSLRTWADKRERITVYPSGTLLEFAAAAELDEALARGLPAVRLADTLAVVASEEAIDYRLFKLTGTRDYALPPERCVRVEPDGVTLTVDVARSDLMLETELPRFAEPAGGPSANGRRRYRLTPASLAAARAGGLTAAALEGWFTRRTGGPLPPAARLLLAGAQAPPRLHHHLVLHVASAELADGLLQWPQTAPLIADRLGPTALVVDQEQVEPLRQRLAEAGIDLAEHTED